MLTHAMLKKVLHYDPVSGVFTWRIGLRRSKPAGSVAGSVSKSDGYRYIKIMGKRRGAHVWAWFYVYGSLPEHEIDHRNNNRDDNHFLNLRPATIRQNRGNSLKSSANKSGYKGVSWHKGAGKWQAFCQKKYLGLFDTPETAHAAYVRAATEEFGPYMRAV